MVPAVRLGPNSPAAHSLKRRGRPVGSMTNTGCKSGRPDGRPWSAASMACDGMSVHPPQRRFDVLQHPGRFMLPALRGFSANRAGCLRLRWPAVRRCRACAHHAARQKQV